MPSFLHNMISYHTWACHKVVESLKSCPEVPPKGVELLSHILQNNWYVLDLIEGNDDGKRWYDIADYTLDECVENNPKIDAAFKELIEGKSEEQLAASVTFTDFSGKVVTRRISDLIFHTHDHCTYHRGQIASLVREHGGEPAKTWFNRWITETEQGMQT